MEHESFGLTDPGTVREANEDAILMDGELGLYIVCDGCGGERAGAEASRLAARVVRAALRGHFDVLKTYAERPTVRRRVKAVELIAAAINAASKKLHELAASDPARAGMGSTIVLLAILGDRAVCAHAGDSRLYLCRRGRVHRLTEDHNLANRYVRLGLLSRKQAERSRSASMVTRVVGRHEEAHADTLHFELVGGDAFLLCTDGLSRYLSDEEIARAFEELPAGRIPAEMVRIARQRGGEDNISAVVVRLAGEPGERGQAVIRGLRALQHVPLFRHLSFEELLRVMDIARVEHHESSARIVAQGEASERLFVVAAGSVEVVRDGAVLARLPAGSLFGEMGLIDRAPRSADIVAAEPVRLLGIGREDFFALLRRERSLAVKVLWGLCCLLNDRLRGTSARLSDSAGIPPAARSRLDELADAVRPFV